ncbi:hypothetical protein IC007_2285 [Sulfuracidifex tepidarius]|uniref:Uncharacterized protein n=1 Tax=Sulfuracidifex tepidarius TaxID=1294262 RepID=A0A510E5C7_9CREN|nr:hypothetical protein IC007_2285 [Sulfuracidifex tepidarius]
MRSRKDRKRKNEKHAMFTVFIGLISVFKELYRGIFGIKVFKRGEIELTFCFLVLLQKKGLRGRKASPL